jgi:L-amino acid N-acyltransferase YncA
MNTRIAQSEDLGAIVSIYNQAVVDGQKTADITPVIIDERRKWFADHTPDKYPVLVADDGNGVLGYLSISAYRPGRMALCHTAEVSYFVHYDHHRRGIASGLLQAAIDMCPSLAIKTLFAIILESNQSSIGLLKKFGFEKWGSMPRVADFNGIEVGHVYYGLRIS